MLIYYCIIKKHEAFLPKYYIIYLFSISYFYLLLFLIVNFNVFSLNFFNLLFSDFDNILNTNISFKLKIFESCLEIRIC